jgi:hypothetical protein
MTTNYEIPTSANFELKYAVILGFLVLFATVPVYAERNLDEEGPLITMMMKEITTDPVYTIHNFDGGDSKDDIYLSEMAPVDLATESASTRSTRAAGSTDSSIPSIIITVGGIDSTSGNSSDLQPLVNTTWQFTYTVGTKTDTTTISCGSNIITGSPGIFALHRTVVLSCTDSQYNPAGATYLPTMGEYGILVKNKVLYESFIFKLQGCCNASGNYYYAPVSTTSDEEYQHPYPLTGTGRTKQPAPRDFDGDEQDDLLWYNKVTGGLFLYTSSKGNYPFGNESVDTGWVAVGVFDYDKDGQADILWWNRKTGEVYGWLGNKTKSSIGFVPDTKWKPCCGGDLDGNGFGDILWFNQTTGGLYVWYDDKQKKVPYGGVDPKLGWLPKGVADFDGDGHGDILWWNQKTGDIFFWTTKNGNYPLSGIPIATGWTVVGAGDFDGDGTPDILWWNQQTGEVSIWDNGGKGTQHSRGLVGDLNWSPL